MKYSSGTFIRTFAPASVSNLNCGFDILGFALEKPGDVIDLQLNDSREVSLKEITGDNGLLPTSVEKNTASAVVKLYLEQTGINQGVAVSVHKQMPLNSGLGSSAASSVAALLGINTLMGNQLSLSELLPLAMEGERLACGNAHADNVAPALFGGLVLIRNNQPADIVSIPIPDSLWVAIIHPDVSIPTREARKVLPEMIPLRDAVVQWGNVAGLIAGFYRNDPGLISRSLHDVVVEQHRSARIPFFGEMRQVAIQAQALGFGISGSGPTVFAFCTSHAIATAVTTRVSALLSQGNVSHQTYVSMINPRGAEVLEIRQPEHLIH